VTYDLPGFISSYVRSDKLLAKSSVLCSATVLLAPCGLAGYLTGRAYSDVDPKTHKLLEDWRRFFCVPVYNDAGSDDGSSHLPLFVEVIVGELFKVSSYTEC
jgi:hypothetical protein